MNCSVPRRPRALLPVLRVGGVSRAVSDLYACPACEQRILAITLSGGRNPVLVPAQYGAFRAERFVARGGMGLVLRGFAAAETQPVAIKLLLPRRGIDRRAAERFKQEIALMRRVRDAHVVRLLSYGVAGHAHKFNFLVAEWIEGPNLRDIIAVHTQTGRLIDFEAAFRWFKQVCQGLAAIHAVGVVHRDIKPSNILIGADGDARVSDLGIAKSMDSAESAITATGEMPGTLEYMAPEQSGQHDAVDQRADLFSLGITFYELLTGHRPLGHYAAASSENTTVPPWFDTILDCLLAPDPDGRFSSAREVVDRLGDGSQSTQVSSRLAPASGDTGGAKPPSSKALAAGPLLRGLWTRLASSKPKSSSDKAPRKLKSAGDPLGQTILPQTKPAAKASGWTRHSLAATIVYIIICALTASQKRGSDFARPFHPQPLTTPLVPRQFLPPQPPSNRPSPFQSPPQNLVVPPISRPAEQYSNPTTPQAPGADSFTNSIGMKLVLIPAGEFLMGSPVSEKDRGTGTSEQQHRVRITRPFYAGMFDVTLGNFLTFYHSSGYKTEAETDGKGGRGFDSAGKFDDHQKPEYTFWNWGKKQTNDHPVVNVSWNDAVAFCEWLSKKEGKTYRLPTEAEWEYACRAGTTTAFHYGASLSSTEANFIGSLPYGDAAKGPTVGNTTPVGSYRPNAFGLYDMHGNVLQWCQDWYDKDYYANSPTDDPQGPVAGSSRVVRGGCWFFNALLCRSAIRGGIEPTDRYDILGFRVVCEQ